MDRNKKERDKKWMQSNRRDVVCPKCGDTRNICYSEWTLIQRGIRFGMCKTCANDKPKTTQRPLKEAIRRLKEYTEWHYAVLTRDKFTCTKCNTKLKNIHVHHVVSLQQIINDYNIKTLDEAIEVTILFDINNGITLCKDCHIDTHKTLMR